MTLGASTKGLYWPRKEGGGDLALAYTWCRAERVPRDVLVMIFKRLKVFWGLL
jgi:hypothetical protein